MNPEVALLICILFILYLFKIDYSHKSGVSIALWIPTIWMMITGSRMVSLWFYHDGYSITPGDYLEGSLFDRNVFLTLIVISAFILNKRKIKWSKIFHSNSLIFLFLFYCGISILWSDFQFVSFKRWIKEIGNLIMVLMVLTDRDPVEAIKTMIRRCAYVLIPLSVVLIKYYPLLGRKYHRYSGALTITGVTTNKNNLGLLCLVCGLFLLWDIVSMWRNKNVSIDKEEMFVQLLILIMVLWLLIKSNSATSLICFIIGICLFTCLGMPFIKRNIKFIGLYMFLSILIVITIGFLFDVVQIIIPTFGRDMTFTGRTELWKDCINLAGNPLIGTGYNSFWLGDTMEQLWDKYWWHPTEAHNGYLETYLELGLIGLFLLIGVIFFIFRNIRKELISDFEYGSFRILFLFIAILYNFTESAFKGMHLMWFVFLLIAINVPRILKKPISGIHPGMSYF
jgi:exopolysaccharide production protein ExoQ